MDRYKSSDYTEKALAFWCNRKLTEQPDNSAQNNYDDRRPRSNSIGGSIPDKKTVRSKSRETKFKAFMEEAKNDKTKPIEISNVEWETTAGYSNNEYENPARMLACSLATAFTNNSCFPIASPQPGEQGTPYDDQSELNFQQAETQLTQNKTFTVYTVSMYDAEDYYSQLQFLHATNLDRVEEEYAGETKMEITANFQGAALNNLDDNTDKIISIQLQEISPHQQVRGCQLVDSGNLKYQSRTKVSKIEFQGVPRDDAGTQTLITKLDHKGSMLAIVANSVHMLYCQVTFCNFETSFCATMSLYSFVQPEDSPPSDAKGKTNLQIDDIAWTQNDAFLLLIFSTGAIAILPRLGSQLLQVYNPTLINLPRKDSHLYQQYYVPRGFNQLFTTTEIKKLIKPKTKAFCAPQHSFDKSLTNDLEAAHNQFPPDRHAPANNFQVTMHPTEDCFIIFDQNQELAFVFRMDLAPELSELFAKQRNMSLYFIRFCFSMDQLSSDPDILSKIPQLLSRKLPLDEFEQNEEEAKRFEEDIDYDCQRQDTVMGIIPFEMEDKNKRLDTMFDFGAPDLLAEEQPDKKKIVKRKQTMQSEDPAVVIKNLKHLLFACRWQKDQNINHLQWLVTIVNDCFYWFLRKSEPMYAFHCLAMAEFYLQKVFSHKSTEDAHSTTPAPRYRACTQDTMIAYRKEVRNVALNYNQAVTKWGESLSGQMDSTNELCMFAQMEHSFVSDLKKTHRKKIKSGADDVSIAFFKNNITEQTPIFTLDDSDRSYLQFQKNYVLLAFYSLVQFRNYQASNFNIIFLLFGCYIINKKFSLNLNEAVVQTIEVIENNFNKKGSTDQNALFFGKHGRNKVEEPMKNIKRYQFWVYETMKLSSIYIQQIFQTSKLEELTEIGFNLIKGVPKTQYYEAKVVRGWAIKRLEAILPQNSTKDPFYLAAPLLIPLKLVGKNGLSEALQIVKTEMTLAFGNYKLNTRVISKVDENNMKTSAQILKQRIGNQSSGFALHFMANTLYHQFCTQETKSLSFNQTLYGLAQFAIKLDKSSPLNCMNQHTLTMDTCFVPSKRILEQQTVYNQLLCEDKAAFRRMLSLMFFHLGDCERGTTVLNDCLQNKLLAIYMLGRTFKSQMKTYEYYRILLADFSISTVTDFRMLQRTTERLNVVYAGKSCLSLLRQHFYRLYNDRNNMKRVKGKKSIQEVMWAAFSLLPSEISIVLKEQIAHDAVKTMKTILRNLSTNQKASTGLNAYSPDASQSQQREPMKIINSGNFGVALEFVLMITEDLAFADISSQFEELLGTDDQVKIKFYEQLELALICFYDQEKKKMLPLKQDSKVNKNSSLKDFSVPLQNCMYFQPRQSKRCFVGCMLYNYHKFIKIILYLQTKAEMLAKRRSTSLYRMQSMDWFVNQGEKIRTEPININMIRDKMALSQWVVQLLYMPTLEDHSTVVTFLFYTVADVINLFSSLSSEGKECVQTEKVLSFITATLQRIDISQLEQYNRDILIEILTSTAHKLGVDHIFTQVMESVLSAPPQQPHVAQKNKFAFEAHVINTAQWFISKVQRKVMFEIHFKKANEMVLDLKRNFFTTAQRARQTLGLNYNTSLFFRGNSFDTKQYNGLDLTEEQVDKAVDSMLQDEQSAGNFKKDEPTFFKYFCADDQALVYEALAPGSLPAMGMSPLILTSRQNHGDRCKSPRSYKGPAKTPTWNQDQIESIIAQSREQYRRVAHEKEQFDTFNPTLHGKTSLAERKYNDKLRRDYRSWKQGENPFEAPQMVKQLNPQTYMIQKAPQVQKTKLKMGSIGKRTKRRNSVSKVQHCFINTIKVAQAAAAQIDRRCFEKAAAPPTDDFKQFKFDPNLNLQMWGPKVDVKMILINDKPAGGVPADASTFVHRHEISQDQTIAKILSDTTSELQCQFKANQKYDAQAARRALVVKLDFEMRKLNRSFAKLQTDFQEDDPSGESISGRTSEAASTPPY